MGRSCSSTAFIGGRAFTLFSKVAQIFTGGDKTPQVWEFHVSDKKHVHKVVTV